MRTELFDYELPAELIAERPPRDRDAGRLLQVTESAFLHRTVRDVPDLVGEGDLLILNETRVRRARLDCHRPSRATGGGARVELLFLGPKPATGGGVGEATEVWEALGKANRPLRRGDVLESELGSLLILGRGEQGILEVRVPLGFEQGLSQKGQMPIPPYLHRPADQEDVARYQTVFAKTLGSAAAPTAGLHLTPELLGRIQGRGTRVAALTLHVGIGTFRPVKTADLDEHPMHAERLSVTSELADAVAQTRRRGGRVVAVGTTVVRALESAADVERDGHVVAREGETKLLIQPGYRFRVVDALLTNFHMPRSTLLALVSAFAGREQVLAAYRVAVQERYRFLSYGDAMWLTRAEVVPR